MPKPARKAIYKIKTKSEDPDWWRGVRLRAAECCFQKGWETNMWINLLYWAGDFEC